MRLTNNLNLPEVIVRAVTNDPYTRGKADISVTQLISPPRIRTLAMRHDEEITEDVSDRIASLMGQLGHLVLERAARDGSPDIHEQRFYQDFDGWVVSGAVDLLRDANYEWWFINDFKYTKVYKVMKGEHADWENQLNCYAHMVRLQGFDVRGLRVIAILKDWSKSKAKRSADYPQSPVVNVDLPLWSMDQAEAYIRERVDLHRGSEGLHDDDLPLCSAKERWVDDQSYALIAKGAMRAKAVFDDPVKALEAYNALKPSLQEVYEIQPRGGQSIRCADYCTAAPFCSQWKAEQSLINPSTQDQQGEEA